MEKLNLKTTDQVNENIKRIGEMFPNCLTERLNDQGKPEMAIDFDQLRQELSKDIVEGPEERYLFTWPDKRNAIRLANAPTTDTLRPVREDETEPTGADSKGKPYCSTGSVNFDTTQNLYIEGDNLQVLKLLREDYLGKIKMIYIDPPYNTGNDFVYNDDFSQSAEEYANNSGQTDSEGNRLVTNSESNGRFHTDWLNMIYPRLKVAKDLLSEDGVIFISIDDNEVGNLRKICNEIYGSTNFLAEFPRVTKKGGKSTDTFAKNHDYILAFCKQINSVVIKGLEHNDDGFKYKDEFFSQRGAYKLNQTLDYNTLGYVNSLDYPIVIDGKKYFAGNVSEEEYLIRKQINPKDGYRWRWSKEMFDFGLKNKWIEVSNSGRIYTKTYLNATIEKADGSYTIVYTKRTKPVTTLDFIGNSFSNDNSNKEITSLLGKAIFDYVKPSSLVRLLALTCSDSNDYILDFFSGSSTTAHAVMQLNAEDGGKRKFIMVQLPELTDEKSEAYKAGYKNICEIGKERIRRAGKKIKEENPLTTQDLDIGFRVLKLDSSNMQDVYYTPEEFNEKTLFDNNIKPDRSQEDLLFQSMVELGIELSAKIERSEIAGKTVWNVADGYLLACFDDNVNETTITEIAKRQPYYFIMRDSSLANDQVADNFEQIFEHYSKGTKRRIL